MEHAEKTKDGIKIKSMREAFNSGEWKGNTRADITERVGRIVISQGRLLNDPELIQHLMSQVIVIRCEHVFEDFCLHYTAISEHFEVKKLGDISPNYEVHLWRDDQAKPCVEFLKMENPSYKYGDNIREEIESQH
jgi:hypothetical protein